MEKGTILMSLFKEIISDVSKQDRETKKLIEDVTSLSSDEIGRIADHVLDSMKSGQGDATELAHEALENVAGMETANDSVVSSAVKKITDAVAAKSKG
jgi:hypothetical protein